MTGPVKGRRILKILLVSLLFLPMKSSAEGIYSTLENRVNVREITIPMANITRAYTILFVTDLHISLEKDLLQQEASLQQEAPLQQEALPQTDNRLTGWIDYANEQKVDALFLGGDILDTPAKENRDHFAKEISRLQCPYLYTNGNHDWTYPEEYMTRKAREEYLTALEPYMDGNPAVHRWETENGDLLAIAIDDSAGQISREALEEVQELLENRGREKPVLLLVHVPFLSQSLLARAREEWELPVVLGGGNYGGIYPDPVSQKFLDEITRADSSVELILAGHVHFFNDDYVTGERSVRQIVGDTAMNRQGILLRLIPSGQ